MQHRAPRRTAPRRTRRGARRGPRGMASLRREYFAFAADPAARYRVRFERIVQHLWEARQSNRRLALRTVEHMDDLVHAVACVDNRAQAWADLTERYESPLVRACRRKLGEIEAILFVRRLLADLRQRHACPPSEKQPSLRGYVAVRPLRNWLSDRLSVALNRELRSAERQRARLRDVDSTYLTAACAGHAFSFGHAEPASITRVRPFPLRLVAGDSRVEVASWPYEPAQEM